MKKAANVILSVSFTLLLLALFFVNKPRLAGAFREEMSGQGTVQEKLLGVERNFQENIWQKEKFVNVYGISLNAFHSKIVGNMDFVKDDHGIIQVVSYGVNTDNFLNSMKQLQATLEERGTPLLYVTLPDKTTYLPLAQSERFAFEGQMSREVGRELDGVADRLDIEALLRSDADAPTFDEFFFKTDVHCSTYGEFWMAKTIAEYLTRSASLVFPNGDTIFDLSHYTVSSHEFLGNTSRSSGEFFTKADQFEIYKPTFDVSLTLDDPSRLEFKTGSFEDVMLNGYEEETDGSKYTYWVLNYGRYPSPYYKYVNHTVGDDAPKILIVSDSAFMRGTTYLALGCKELTVLDPRFFGAEEYLAPELVATEYDAVVVMGCSNGFYSTSFASKLELPDAPTVSMVSPEEYGQWIGDHGICVDTCNGRETSSTAPLQVERDRSFTLQGWAADFSADAPFSALYLQVGDALLKCDYGAELAGMVSHFDKESLLKSGFAVTVPWACLQDGAVTEISFIAVSADGQALYQPVICQLAY